MATRLIDQRPVDSKFANLSLGVSNRYPISRSWLTWSPGDEVQKVLKDKVITVKNLYSFNPLFIFPSSILTCSLLHFTFHCSRSNGSLVGAPGSGYRGGVLYVERHVT